VLFKVVSGPQYLAGPPLRQVRPKDNVLVVYCIGEKERDSIQDAPAASADPGLTVEKSQCTDAGAGVIVVLTPPVSPELPFGVRKTLKPEIREIPIDVCWSILVKDQPNNLEAVPRRCSGFGENGTTFSLETQPNFAWAVVFWVQA
jgi:hypothetical protein